MLELGPKIGTQFGPQFWAQFLFLFLICLLSINFPYRFQIVAFEIIVLAWEYSVNSDVYKLLRRSGIYDLMLLIHDLRMKTKSRDDI